MSKSKELLEELIELSEDDVQLAVGLPSSDDGIVVLGTINAIDLIQALTSQDEQVPVYDDPYSEILKKILEALKEAAQHEHNMNGAEYFIFQAIAFVINEKDPDAQVPEMS